MFVRYHTFFHHLDHYRSDAFLWVLNGVGGLDVHGDELQKRLQAKSGRKVDVDSEDEADGGGGAEEG